MIFRMKIEKGCLYSERYRVQYCFDRSTLELSNSDYIIDLFVHYRHLIDTIELHNESEVETLNKLGMMLKGIKVDNRFEKLVKSAETQDQNIKTDDIVDQKDSASNVPSDKDVSNTKGRRTKKIQVQE